MPLDQAARAERVQSACPHDCPSTCALEVERLDARTIGRVYGADANPYTAGVICAKVARYAERIHHPGRLTTPLIRTGAKGVGLAAFQPLSWDDALDEVAARLMRAAERDGPEAVWPYFYAGTMGLVQRDGIERLRHVMKYSRQHSTICNALSDAGWMAGVGVKRGVDAREIAQSELIVVWGTNAVNTQVNLMHHVAEARKARDVPLVVVDPYLNATAKLADIHLMLRPGTDGALAAAVMHVLFKEGFADRDYLARYTDAPAELEAHLATRTPEWAAAITGLAPAEIVDFARLYGGKKRSYLRVGYGFSRSRNGAANLHAVTCLPAVTGAWQYPGGGALYSNAGLYKLDRTLIMGLDALDRSVRLLDQSRLGPILLGDRRDIGEGPPVTALFVQNTNPAVVCPESGAVRDGLSRPDLFVCVHEQFMTETAAMADIVLPATTFLEHDDVYVGGGHTFLQVTRKVVEPVGESRSNHQVLCGLAERLGAKHPGFGMSEWEIIDETLRRSGMPDAETAYAMRWVDCALPFERAHFLDGFGHADGKFHFKADWAALGRDHAGLEALPGHSAVIDAATEERPYRLIAAPARSFLNSSFNNTVGSLRREGRPTALIHPADCEALGIAEGDRVRLGNAKGSVLVHAKPFGGLQRRVVVVESVWPNDAFEEGIGINLLTSADPGLPVGGAVFHDTAIWVRPA